jgi:V8-like Glu-specific endopeptidase
MTPWSDGDAGITTAIVDSDDATDESASPLVGVEPLPEYVPLSTAATAAADSAPEDGVGQVPVDADYADDPEFWKQLVSAAKSVGKGVARGARVLSDSGLLTTAASTAARALGVPSPVASAVTAFLSKRDARRESGEVESDESDTHSLLEVVIGADDRVRIANTAVLPWSGICHLSITAANGQRFLGTGWMISPRCVITAGHCVFIRSAGGWVKNIHVTPGRNGTLTPFGQVAATRFSAMPAWVAHNDRNSDCGCIILPKAPRAKNGALPFRFGYTAKSASAISARALNISGYPGDKDGVTQWFHARLAKSVSARVITYDIDTAGGQSGSPVWHLENATRTAVGIHTNGSPLGNSATRITAAIKAQMDAWRASGL